MKACLDEIAPGSGFSHLCPHLKTNKSTLITKMLLDEGIGDVKVTMNEVDMALRAGAKSIFIAYPLLKPDAVSAHVGHLAPVEAAVSWVRSWA